MRKFLTRRSLRNVVPQSGKCFWCDQDIVRSTPHQLWQATSGDLALHDAEYCADAKINGSRVNGHKLAPTEN